MAPVVRILKLLGAALVFLTYLWFDALRYAPLAKARKARRRAARQQDPAR